MKIYFAGVDRVSFLPVLWSSGVRRILISYADYRHSLPKFLEHLRDYQFEVMLDSGAYSAYTRGIKLDVGDYAELLKEYGEYFKCYFNLDVVGDFEETWKNQDYLEGEGLKPIPVFHYGEPLEVLLLISRGYSFIGLGGMVPIHQNKLDRWLGSIFRDKEGGETFKNTSFHGLGLTTISLLRKYPFESCDSTKWLIAKRWGEILVGDGTRVKSEDATMEQGIKWHLEKEREIAESVRKCESQMRLI